MLDTLNNIDTELFYLINHHHCTVMDYVMWFFSSKWSWMLAMVLAYLFTLLRHQEDRRLWWLPIAAMGLCFLFADQTSNWIKDSVCRLRPCWALDDVMMFHTKKGGQYGFVSSHAANAFAIATFFFLRYRRWPGMEKGKALIVPIIFAVWAVLTSYSRAYLGKHYPGDVVCGALLGILMGYLVHLIASWIEKKLQQRETKK